MLGQDLDNLGTNSEADSGGRWEQPRAQGEAISELHSEMGSEGWAWAWP